MNKKGWTLVQELLAILIAVVLLVYVIFGLNRMGLIRDMDEALLPGVKPDLIISGKTVNYEIVERNIVNAAKEYVSDYYNNDINEDKVIRISHLIKNGYLSTIRDNKNKVCTGYVKVKKDTESVNYLPYLKCSNYTSYGYEEEYDW